MLPAWMRLLIVAVSDLDVTKGGGEKNVQRHESRGKLFVRDRINP